MAPSIEAPNILVTLADLNVIQFCLKIYFSRDKDKLLFYFLSAPIFLLFYAKQMFFYHEKQEFCKFLTIISVVVMCVTKDETYRIPFQSAISKKLYVSVLIWSGGAACLS